MNARLRVLPIPGRVPGEGDHYLILDGDLRAEVAEQYRTVLEGREGAGIPLAFGFPVELPEVYTVGVDASDAQDWRDAMDSWRDAVDRYLAQTEVAAARALEDAEELSESPGPLTVHVEVPEGVTSELISSRVLEALRANGLRLAVI